MGYGIGGVIEAADYNAFINGGATGSVGAASFPISVGLNSMWNDLGPHASYGYGQTPAFTPVTVGSPILATTLTTEWQRYYDVLFKTAIHQGTTISLTPTNARHVTVTGGTMPPTLNKIITWESSMDTILSTLASSRLNAAQQGGTTSSSGTNSTPWAYSLTFNFTIDFGSDLAARYYFNSGGQILAQTSHVAGGTYDIDQLVSDICDDAGTMVLSSPDGGANTPATATLAGTSYTGVIKSGGSNPPGETVYPNNGFYSMYSATGTTLPLLKQIGNFYYFPYDTNSFILYSGSYNGAGLLSLSILIDIVPDVYPGYTSESTTATVTLRPPSTTVLANTWGTPTISLVSIIPV